MKSKMKKVLFISLLFAAKISLAAEMNNAEGPLIRAIAEGKPFDEIKSLVENKADVNKKDDAGWPALLWAIGAERHDYGLSEFLINAGANVGEGPGNCSALCAVKEQIKFYRVRGLSKNQVSELKEIEAIILENGVKFHCSNMRFKRSSMLLGCVMDD